MLEFGAEAQLRRLYEAAKSSASGIDAHPGHAIGVHGTRLSRRALALALITRAARTLLCAVVARLPIGEFTRTGPIAYLRPTARRIGPGKWNMAARSNAAHCIARHA